VSEQARGAGLVESPSLVGWCCSYCAAPLESLGHGLFCAAEGRWFATHDGVHRLLPEERRRELLPALEMYQRVRRDEGWRAEPGLPDVLPTHPRARRWRARAAALRYAGELAVGRLGAGPWRVLEVGAGCCWAGLRLAEEGHRVVAIDLSLDGEDGLRAAERVSPAAARLHRAEAEMEAVPVEPGSFDLILAADALHHAPRLARTLVELRRVTRRDGLLVAFDSPVYRRRQDGEAVVAERMRAQARRYGMPVDRDGQPGYLVAGELPGLFRSAGWSLEAHGSPGRAWDWGRDVLDLLRHRRRRARYPVLCARREG
jgi:SAM-dependent methyltransferase